MILKAVETELIKVRKAKMKAVFGKIKRLALSVGWIAVCLCGCG